MIHLFSTYYYCYYHIIVVRARVEAPKELTMHVRVIIIGRVVSPRSRFAVVHHSISARLCVQLAAPTDENNIASPTRSGSLEIYLFYFFNPFPAPTSHSSAADDGSPVAAAAVVPSSGATIFSTSPPPPPSSTHHNEYTFVVYYNMRGVQVQMG